MEDERQGGVKVEDEEISLEFSFDLVIFCIFYVLSTSGFVTQDRANTVCSASTDRPDG
ncbi:hypothetical protein Sjap_004686 [Stephania japonica]|uniref:Uncharacterized protein n=1 Tax=Stephania japonica TaxID=461633 RepID=A0AAP0K471_9MAGN